MHHIAKYYVNGEFNKVVQFSIPKESGNQGEWIMMPLSEADGTSRIGYCTTYYLYPEDADTWKDVPKTAPFYPIDVDCGGDSYKAQQEAIRIIDSLQLNWGVEPKKLGIWFSGRGFHLEIPADYFGGFEPSKDLHIIFENIYDKLGLITDTCFKKSTQQYRYPNSINAKSGLHKIQLDLSELYEPIENIVEMAKTTQKIRQLDLDNITPLEPLVAINKTLTPPKGKAALTTPSAASNTHSIKRLKIDGMMGGVVMGFRNYSAFTLAIDNRYVKRFSITTTTEILTNWNQLNLPPLEQSELMNCIRSAYNYTDEQKLPVGAFQKFLNTNEIILSLPTKPRQVYEQLVINTNWDTKPFFKDDKQFTVFPNQAVYTKSWMSKRTSISPSYCTKILNQLANNYHTETDLIKLVPESAKGSNSWTRVIHIYYNQNHYK